jgi:hypothetical protein
MIRSLRCVFLSSFPLFFAAGALCGPALLRAQAPDQTPNQTPTAAPSSAPANQPASQPSDSSPQTSDTGAPNTSHNSGNAWKPLLRDLAKTGMNRAGLHGGPGGSGPGGPHGGGPNGGGSGSGPAMSSYPEDGVHYGSGIRPSTGAGIGSSDFNGGISNGFSGDTGNAFGGDTENQFSGAPGNGFRSSSAAPGSFNPGSFNLGSLSQLSGNLGRGLAAGGHTNAAAALGALPSFSQSLHSGFSLPVSSSLGSFRLSYQSPLSLTNNFQIRDMNSFGSSMAAYDSPHLRSGHIDFSAAAKVGVGSTTGMSDPGGMGQSGFGGHTPGRGGNSSDPSSSVSFRLLF